MSDCAAEHAHEATNELCTDAEIQMWQVHCDSFLANIAILAAFVPQQSPVDRLGTLVNGRLDLVWPCLWLA